MILFRDEDEKHLWEVTLYDIKNKKRYPIIETFNDPGFGTMAMMSYYTIDKVTPHYVYIGFSGGFYKDYYRIKIKR